MKLNTLQKTLLLVIIMMLVIIVPKYSFAAIERVPVEGGTTTLSPSQITGDSGIELETDFVDKITDFVSKIGAFIAVGVLMVIGIKYMTGSLEEKATYKKSMIPYIIGCFLLFGASILAPKIGELVSGLGDDTEEIGNNILGIIQAVGTLIAVGTLMLIGLKYLVGSVEEKANYKKTMLPYIIGAVLLFSAVNVTTLVYQASISVASNGEYNNGISAAQGFIDSVGGDYSRVEKHVQDTEENYPNWANSQGDGEYYYEGYLDELKSWLSKNKQ